MQLLMTTTASCRHGRIRKRQDSATPWQEDALGGLQSQHMHDSCACTPKWPNKAITLARGMYKWGNTREGGEAEDGVVCGDFFQLCQGCESDLESGEADLL
jgi:hypothetical protein